MSFDLTSESREEFSFSNSGWRYLIEFAKLHGFEWPVEHDGDDKSSLTAAESASLASAIERGLGDRSPAETAARVSAELTERLLTPESSPLFSAEPLVFDEKTIEYWRDFAAFARRGGFSVSF